MRFMFDTNVYDELLADPETCELLLQALQSGRVRVVRTHVEEDELGRVCDVARRSALLAIWTSLGSAKTPTTAAVWGVSKWGGATWTGAADRDRLERLRRGNPKHTRDAILTLTAAANVDVFVTQEARRSGGLPRRASSADVHIPMWTFAQLRDYLRQLDTIQAGEA